jgi:hypothetical protein
MNNNKKILFINFEEYNQQMYPHTYDFMNLLSENYDLEYCHNDDRGSFANQIYLNSLKIFQMRDPIRSFLSLAKNIVLMLRMIKNCIIQWSFIRNAENLVIAVDHFALLVTMLTKKKNTKLVFFSHDFIDEKHIWFNSSFVRYLLNRNKYYSDRIDLIIIQDKNRGESLDKILNTGGKKKYYLPISLSKKQNIECCRFEKSNLDFNQIKISQIGSISSVRLSHLLLDCFQGTDERVLLYFKGFVEPAMLAKISEANKKPSVVGQSQNLKNYRRFINSIDIGVLFYHEDCENERYLSKASGQLVEYLMQSKPVLTYGNCDLGNFIEENQCGVYLQNLLDFNESIIEIVKNYDIYAKQSANIYNKYFNFDNYSQSLIEELDALV